MTILEVKNLSKTFGRVEALKNISFKITKGKIVGFLGPNGAGKSTTMNVLMGFIAPTSGEAHLFGEKVSPNTQHLHANLGFLSANMPLDNSLTVLQEIKYFAALAKTDTAYALELSRRLALDLKIKVKNLSTGNRQKLALVVAFLNKPKLLILDEPTNGLDPLAQDEFNKIIKELGSSGTTVFISSHILSEISSLCDEFIFIKQGEIVANLIASELHKIAGESLSVPSTTETKKLLRDHNIKYSVEPGSLEKIFLKFYSSDKEGK
jgi:ABC-2 type transport system ATP-binding protein